MNFDPYTLRMATAGIVLAISSVHIAVLTFVFGILLGYSVGRGIRYNKVISQAAGRVRNGKKK